MMWVAIVPEGCLMLKQARSSWQGYNVVYVRTYVRTKVLSHISGRHRVDWDSFGAMSVACTCRRSMTWPMMRQHLGQSA